MYDEKAYGSRNENNPPNQLPYGYSNPRPIIPDGTLPPPPPSNYIPYPHSEQSAPPMQYPAPSDQPSSGPGLSHLSALYSTQSLEQIYNTPAPPRAPDLQTSMAMPQGSGVPVQGVMPAKQQNYYATSVAVPKYQKKVYFPLNTGINYIGLLIGPKGMYQKKLEDQTRCKILIRGKYLDRTSHRGMQKDKAGTNAESEEEQHVLVFFFNNNEKYRL